MSISSTRINIVVFPTIPNILSFIFIHSFIHSSHVLSLRNIEINIIYMAQGFSHQLLLNERNAAFFDYFFLTSPSPWRYKLSFHTSLLTHVFYFRIFFPTKYVFLACDTYGLGNKFSRGRTFCHLFQRQNPHFSFISLLLL